MENKILLNISYHLRLTMKTMNYTCMEDDCREIRNILNDYYVDPFHSNNTPTLITSVDFMEDTTFVVNISTTAERIEVNEIDAICDVLDTYLCEWNNEQRNNVSVHSLVLVNNDPSGLLLNYVFKAKHLLF